MQMDLYNTLPILHRYFTERIKPSELLPRYLEWAESESGIMTMLNQIKKKQGFQDFDLLSVVRSDGIDILEAQQQYGLFNPTRNREASKWCFDESERLLLQERIEKELKQIAKALPAALLPDRLTVCILPADCANGQFMLHGSGISGYGRTPNYLFIRVWPTSENLNRLGPVLARNFIHGIRRSNQQVKSSISLGEAMVMEGIAASFVHRMFPDWKHPEFIGFLPADDWEETLSHIAGYYGKGSYDDVLLNIYGTQIRAGSMRPPKVTPMPQETFKYAWEQIKAHVESTETHIVASHLYGDPLVTAQGHPSFGIPHLAGFEAGFHVVQRYLLKTGASIAETLAIPWQDIVSTKGVFE